MVGAHLVGHSQGCTLPYTSPTRWAPGLDEQVLDMGWSDFLLIWVGAGAHVGAFWSTPHGWAWPFGDTPLPHPPRTMPPPTCAVLPAHHRHGHHLPHPACHYPTPTPPIWCPPHRSQACRSYTDGRLGASIPTTFHHLGAMPAIGDSFPTPGRGIAFCLHSGLNSRTDGGLRMARTAYLPTGCCTYIPGRARVFRGSG